MLTAHCCSSACHYLDRMTIQAKLKDIGQVTMSLPRRLVAEGLPPSPGGRDRLCMGVSVWQAAIVIYCWRIVWRLAVAWWC
jgi:hypothetical protein